MTSAMTCTPIPAQYGITIAYFEAMARPAGPSRFWLLGFFTERYYVFDAFTNVTSRTQSSVHLASFWTVLLFAETTSSTSSTTGLAITTFTTSTTFWVTKPNTNKHSYVMWERDFYSNVLSNRKDNFLQFPSLSSKWMSMRESCHRVRNKSCQLLSLESCSRKHLRHLRVGILRRCRYNW
jgi:hypothetical protein